MLHAIILWQLQKKKLLHKQNFRFFITLLEHFIFLLSSFDLKLLLGMSKTNEIWSFRRNAISLFVIWTFEMQLFIFVVLKIWKIIDLCRYSFLFFFKVHVIWENHVWFKKQCYIIFEHKYSYALNICLFCLEFLNWNCLILKFNHTIVILWKRQCSIIKYGIFLFWNSMISECFSMISALSL